MSKQREGYYDYMLRRTREENKKMKVKVDEGINLDTTGNELYRREIIALTNKVEVLKDDMKNLTQDFYKLLNRVKELSEENNFLRESLENK
tara:strand:+ start:322 stop:594 length:273 start_codon:yes stop_codon:yes gene_type:complete